ncbi:MAG: Tol-Pal system beta propeller repeat protein TolB [Nitrospinae bacterium CG11_big_fil_rev_8_21_14_0_20_56_8]|nr:MAG: Tol-Pal system beta propeller repeat protein TolB [Nitrospinae bacterium CG11_big_fil_rev_8_21_14_0_20_56_8]
MFPKLKRPVPDWPWILLFAGMLLPHSAWAQPNVRIEMERETRQEVTIAVPRFNPLPSTRDPEGLGEEARKILSNDLKLSELFAPVPPSIYQTLEQNPGSAEVVDYGAWNRLGVQWLIKTEIERNLEKKMIALTFRLFDTVNERFLFGKRYHASENYLRKIVHRFADEVVLQLTGKPGVAGSRLVFLSKEAEKAKEIYRVDFDGENLTRLTRDGTINISPAWSPDGKWVAYTSYAAGNPDLVMVDAEGKNDRKTLLRLPGLNAAASWGPDGKKIALTLSKDENSEVYILNDDFTLKRMTRHFSIDTSPTWSPDGKRIAFTSDRAGVASPQIYIMDAKKGDQAGVQRITFNSSYNDNPAWSPDGDRLAYTSLTNGKMQIRIYDLTTKKTELFTTEGGNNEEPSWSPDGRFLAYKHTEKNRTQIFIKRMGGKKSRQLTFAPGGGHSPAWSPYLK